MDVQRVVDVEVEVEVEVDVDVDDFFNHAFR